MAWSKNNGVYPNTTVFRQTSSMASIRRLINFYLMLAFASYGLVVAAPAHAHGHSSNQVAALHALTADIDQAGHDHYHDHDGADDQSANDAQAPGDATHGDYHVHSVAAFTTVDESVGVTQPVRTASTIWSDLPNLSVSGLFSPLKKPPRILL